MKSEKNVGEILRRILWLKENLSDITELKEKAFEVFDECFDLDEMDAYLKEYWNELICWNHYANNDEKHFGCLEIQGGKTIKRTFEDVRNASINRKEFAEALEKTREGIEIYIKELEAELTQQQQHLNELYDEFAQGCGDFGFIFKEASIKQLIMENFLKV